MKTLTPTQVKKLVDEGGRIKTQLDALQKKLNDITNKLKAHAKATNKHTLIGSAYEYNLSDTEFLKIDPETLKEITTETQFMQLIKVDITKAKKELGEDTIRNFGVVEKKRFYRGQFKSLK